MKSENEELSFLGHLEELRWRLVRSCVVIILAAIVLFYFTDPIVQQFYINMSKTTFPTYHAVINSILNILLTFSTTSTNLTPWYRFGQCLHSIYLLVHRPGLNRWHRSGYDEKDLVD